MTYYPLIETMIRQKIPDLPGLAHRGHPGRTGGVEPHRFWNRCSWRAQSGSPLRQALLESGLGSTLADGSGYDTDNKDTMFTCGLKDCQDGLRRQN
ncbi:MAG: hypothetical protein R2875_07775 [Desulfobacterales bacterium]